MNTLIRQLALAGMCLLSAGTALAGTAKVNYDRPEHYGDMPFSQWEREEVLSGLTEHFQYLAKNLPDDQELQVTVLDLDMAGRLVPSGRGVRDLRVMTGGADWPRMELRYSIVAGGAVLRSGQARLSDMAYLNRSNRFSEGEALRFEKQMIDDWFYKEIAPKKKQAR